MLRILIADDHAIIRKGLKQILLDEYPSAIVEEVNDAEEAIKKTLSNEWDIIICDSYFNRSYPARITLAGGVGCYPFNEPVNPTYIAKVRTLV